MKHLFWDFGLWILLGYVLGTLMQISVVGTIMGLIIVAVCALVFVTVGKIMTDAYDAKKYREGQKHE